ncbi:5257_t:CDS:2, partial [Paraglomus brasilianum]
KEHNLEKSWEFKEPIPAWLKRIHQHREDLATTTDTTDFESLSQIAETESLLSNLPSDWEVLEPPVERCLHSIATLDKKGLKKVAKTVMHHGVCGAIKKIRKILTTSNKVEDENPFLDSPPTEITTADNIVQGGDYKHPDVCYIIELLRYTELLHKHELAKDLTWGREFSLCERSGSKIEDGRKILDNTLKVQKTLRDMHQTLLETLSNAGGGAVVVQAFRKLILPGFISSRFFVRVLLNVYIGGKYHGSIMLAEFDIPTQFDEMGNIVAIAQMMLNVKNIFKQTIKTFILMKEASEKKKHSVENVLVSSRVKEHVTPKAKLRNEKLLKLMNEKINRTFLILRL